MTAQNLSGGTLEWDVLWLSNFFFQLELFIFIDAL